MKKTITLLAILLAITGVQAQIPADVVNVMNRSRAAMTSPTGIEYEIDMKAGIGPLAMKMHIVAAEKGNLQRSTTTTKIMGIDIVTESGFDGTDTWEINHSSKGDTITFTRGNHQKKSSGYLELNFDHQYNKAKMNLKDGFYEITFSDPKDKNSEVKSVTVKISATNYVVHEVRSGARGAKVTMTVTKVRVGLADSYFKLNLSKYPDAVVVRK